MIQERNKTQVKILKQIKMEQNILNFNDVAKAVLREKLIPTLKKKKNKPSNLYLKELDKTTKVQS